MSEGPKNETTFVKRRAPALYAIIAFKLVKGMTLLLLALGAYSLSDNNLPEEFRRLLEFFHLDPEKKFFSDVAAKIADITPGNLIWLARGTVLYALFSLIEGTGLLFRVPWAGWLAIGESAFFIPIEVHEVMRQTPWSKGFYAVFAVLAVNVFIVWYLFKNRERLFRHHHHGQQSPPK